MNYRQNIWLIYNTLSFSICLTLQQRGIFMQQSIKPQGNYITLNKESIYKWVMKYIWSGTSYCCRLEAGYSTSEVPVKQYFCSPLMPFNLESHFLYSIIFFAMKSGLIWTKIKTRDAFLRCKTGHLWQHFKSIMVVTVMLNIWTWTLFFNWNRRHVESLLISQRRFKLTCRLRPLL